MLVFFLTTYCEKMDEEIRQGWLRDLERAPNSLRAVGSGSTGTLKAKWGGVGNSFTVELEMSEGQYDLEGPCRVTISGEWEWAEFLQFVQQVEKQIRAPTLEYPCRVYRVIQRELDAGFDVVLEAYDIQSQEFFMSNGGRPWISVHTTRIEARNAARQAAQESNKNSTVRSYALDLDDKIIALGDDGGR
jgi:hypothetical protein